MKKYLNTVLSIIIVTLICLLSYNIGYYGYNAYDNIQKMRKLIEEINTQNEILHNKIQMQETVSLIRDYLIVENINKILKQLHQKPSYEYLKSVTVRIFQEQYTNAGKGWVGTGSIIKITDDYTYILTNKHVAPMSNKDNIYVAIVDKNQEYIYTKAEVIKNAVLRDLSLIRVPGKLKHKKTIKGFAKTSYAEKIYSVGMYLSNQDIYSEGTVAGVQDIDILINMPSAPGCSGSGIFNKNGELVGVLYAGNRIGYFTLDTSKAICVPVHAILLFLEGII